MPTEPRKIASNKKWRDANREHVRALGRKYYEKHQEERRAASKVYREKNIEVYRARDRAKNLRQRIERRQEIIAHLGGKCVRCGFSDWRALQVDHINGGGGKDRQSCGSAFAYYRKILADDSSTYQLLCANCNQIKRMENNEHRTNRKGE